VQDIDELRRGGMTVGQASSRWPLISDDLGRGHVRDSGRQL